ncbi:hypothetical protein TTHERM_00566890 (macronuclear) [Tetrahymena thermophila SB210]|uniref:Uncharacterized protein n=1 Tax=Tetrahymena thermophila (strain SB210) TaxID=312017 RepID=I7LWI1_TETTS|nr:hypothetical protein TTHERM_00566890 [Tetrahymena thermophila SB210]EAS01845.4 hypothetical protein TTHERM_00566890 [Tetrahymena thermophila SB210]|eukprot:XP_001022090.4 hypothetical protein TTHERM_00566890 [Tetrahymena thermophila SB210]
MQMDQLLTYFAGNIQIVCNQHEQSTEISSCQDSQDIMDEAQIVSLNKKNVIRNLIRAFLQYLFGKNQKVSILQQYFPNSSDYDTKCQIKRYFAKKKYNHLVLKQLYKHQIYGQMFKQFLLTEAHNYLQRSQIKEKENHVIFINYMIKCYEDERLLEKLETYSKAKKI